MRCEEVRVDAGFQPSVQAMDDLGVGGGQTTPLGKMRFKMAGGTNYTKTVSMSDRRPGRLPAVGE